MLTQCYGGSKSRKITRWKMQPTRINTFSLIATCTKFLLRKLILDLTHKWYHVTIKLQLSPSHPSTMRSLYASGISALCSRILLLSPSRSKEARHPWKPSLDLIWLGILSYIWTDTPPMYSLLLVSRCTALLSGRLSKAAVSSTLRMNCSNEVRKTPISCHLLSLIGLFSMELTVRAPLPTLYMYCIRPSSNSSAKKSPVPSPLYIINPLGWVVFNWKNIVKVEYKLSLVER